MLFNPAAISVLRLIGLSVSKNVQITNVQMCKWKYRLTFFKVREDRNQG